MTERPTITVQFLRVSRRSPADTRSALRAKEIVELLLAGETPRAIRGRLSLSRVQYARAARLIDASPHFEESPVFGPYSAVRLTKAGQAFQIETVDDSGESKPLARSSAGTSWMVSVLPAVFWTDILITSGDRPDAA